VVGALIEAAKLPVGRQVLRSPPEPIRLGESVH
jgi:hypothetical protein